MSRFSPVDLLPPPPQAFPYCLSMGYAYMHKVLCLISSPEIYFCFTSFHCGPHFSEEERESQRAPLLKYSDTSLTICL